MIQIEQTSNGFLIQFPDGGKIKKVHVGTFKEMIHYVEVFSKVLWPEVKK